jgi:hypothetical protein
MPFEPHPPPGGKVPHEGEGKSDAMMLGELAGRENSPASELTAFDLED